MYLAKNHGINLSTAKDGLEWISRALLLLAVGSIFIGIPGCFYAAESNWSFFHLLNTGCWSLNLSEWTILALLFSADWVHAVGLSLIILYHCNSMLHWIERSHASW